MLVRCDFMEPPEKGGGPTDRLLCWDPGGGWPLVGSWTGWRNPASHRSRKQPELVPPVAGRRTRVLFSTSSTESGGATCAPRLACQDRPPILSGWRGLLGSSTFAGSA